MGSRSDPLSRQESYAYDLKGNLVSTTDRKGQVTSATYDGLNRPTLIGYNTQVSGGNITYESSISYTYDAGDRRTQATDTAGGIISDAYDNLDRLTNETTAQGSVGYTYDNAGRRTSMTVVGQPQVSYSYDNDNRLTQITQKSASVGFGYDNGNRRISLIVTNGLNVTYSYDESSRLTALTYLFGANTLGSLTYAYDGLGRRTQEGGTFANTGLPTPIGAATYDAANQLVDWNGVPISYDNNGNMQSDGVNSFAWNARNQLASLNSVSLQYDAFGRRIKNTIGTTFFYDGANAVQEQSGGSVSANVLSGSRDEFFARADTLGTTTPLQDGLGNVIALVSATGNIQTTYSYDPFGNTVASGATSANTKQYTGRENEGNGLYYLRARYYSPVLHRFVNEDPLGFASGDVNLHAYTGDDPTNFTDRKGLARDCFWSSCGGLPGAASAGLGGRKDKPKFKQSNMWRPNWLQCLAMDWFGAVAGIDCTQGPGGPVITVEMDNGQVFTAYGGLIEGGDATVTGYRAVDMKEFQDILDNGAFQGSPTGSEVKYFFDTPQQAQDFGLRMYGEDNFRIVSGSFANSTITRINPATEGPGFVVPNDELPGVKPEVVPEP